MAFPSSNPTPISSKRPSLIIPPFHSTTALFFPLSLSIHSSPPITRFRHLHITNSSTPTITVSPSKPSVSDVTLNPSRKGCDILVEALEREGVTHVFAYPGACTIDIHQSLTHSSIIRTILPRHEQGGVFAAEGYARASGLPGVCIATSGPGATNLVSGITDAMFDSIPIVAITGQVPRGLIGTDAFQEAPVVELTSPITKRNYQVWNVEDIPRIVREAFYLAKSGRPGPVLIDIPKDISQEFVVPNWDQPMKLTDYMLTLPNPVNKSCLERILRLIGESKKPVLYVGGGCLDSSNELRRFVELTGIPVASTLMGLGSFPCSDDLSLQMLGLYGTYYANYAVDNSDLLLAFGVRFDDHVTGKLEAFASRAKIVHIDIDRSELGKNKQPDISIFGDIKIALQGLNEILENRNLDRDFDFSSWRHELNEQKTSHPMKFETIGGAIPPQYAIQVLDDLTGGNAIIATGVGNHQMWSAQFYKYDRPRQWLTSGGLGAMGFGLPAAMGACLARPDAVVVDIDGDGSFMMNVQELATIRAENLPVKIMVINNQCLGMPVQFEDRLFNGNRGHTFLGNPSKESEIFPDMVKFAEACDIPAMRVMKKEKVRSAVKEMLDTPGPYLLDVVISHKEFVFPVIPNGGTFKDVIIDADAW